MYVCLCVCVCLCACLCVCLPCESVCAFVRPCVRVVSRAIRILNASACESGRGEEFLWQRGMRGKSST